MDGLAGLNGKYMNMFVKKRFWRILPVLAAAIIVFFASVGACNILDPIIYNQVPPQHFYPPITYDDAHYERLPAKHSYKVPKVPTNKSIGIVLGEIPGYVIYQCKEYVDGPLIIVYDKIKKSYDYYVFDAFIRPHSQRIF